MENIGKLIEVVKVGMQRTFVIYGYEISWWQIFIFVIVASIICALIRGLME